MSPLQRHAYLLGFRRAQVRARKQARAVAHEFEAELALLQVDLTEIATELYRERYSRAVGEAILERTANPGTLLN